MTSSPLDKGGLCAALSAYVMWGILPIYWKLLQAAGAYEILAHRIVWSFIFMFALLLFLGKMHDVKRESLALWRNKKRLLAVAGGGVIVSTNWFTYIWAVNSGYIVETSLGYYINPLVSVLFGVLLFSEKLSRSKQIAFAIATLGILNMTYQLGELPFIALYLAVSFATYGALKKYAGLDPFIGIALETLLVTPFALIYIAHLVTVGESSFTLANPVLSLLLAGAGAITAIPLILFARGINTLPLNVVGFLQYCAPTIALLIGVFVYNEPFTSAHAVSFSFIWLALIIFSSSEWLAYRHNK